MPAALAWASALAMDAAFEGETAMPSTPDCDQVIDHLQLLLAAAVLAGADVAAFDRAAELLLGLLATVAGLIEERVVHVLRHQREGVVRSAGRAGRCQQSSACGP